MRTGGLGGWGKWFMVKKNCKSIFIIFALWLSYRLAFSIYKCCLHQLTIFFLFAVPYTPIILNHIIYYSIRTKIFQIIFDFYISYCFHLQEKKWQHGRRWHGALVCKEGIPAKVQYLSQLYDMITHIIYILLILPLLCGSYYKTSFLSRPWFYENMSQQH